MARSFNFEEKDVSNSVTEKVKETGVDTASGIDLDRDRAGTVACDENGDHTSPMGN